jgi:hypothetical protein
MKLIQFGSCKIIALAATLALAIISPRSAFCSHGEPEIVYRSNLDSRIRAYADSFLIRRGFLAFDMPRQIKREYEAIILEVTNLTSDRMDIKCVDCIGQFEIEDIIDSKFSS